jgi:ribosomal protein S18 acetylase RimI-like enzyme
MLEIARSAPRDVARVCAFDPMARDNEERRALLAEWTAGGLVQIGTIDDDIVGFAVLTRHFFQQPFIDLVIVAEGQRRHGHGLALVRHCVELAPGDKIWTSTNQSNLAMQALLAKAGFVPSGRVDNLDPGDPELIFVHLPEAPGQG